MSLNKISEFPKRLNFSLFEGIIVSLILTLFLSFTLLSFSHKSVVGDTMLHYYTGKLALGADWNPGDPLGWDGTMPVSALNVLADQLYLLIEPNPKFPEVFPYATINRPAAASLPSIALGALLVLAIWGAGRFFLGTVGGLFAAFLAATEPNLMGNSRWITTDIPATLMFFAVLVAIACFVEKPTLRRFYFMAAIVALAQITKVTNLILIGFAGLAVCWVELSTWRNAIRTIQNLDKTPVAAEQKPASAIINAVFGVSLKGSFLIVAALFALQLAYSGYDPDIAVQIESEPELVETWVTPFWALRPLVPAPYSLTVGQARLHNHLGHSAFFWGNHYTHGDWRFFPFAVLVKTPLPLLLLALCGLGFYRKIPRALWLILFASAVYFLYFCFLVNVNIGLRHVLQVYPAMILLAAFGAQQLWSYTLLPQYNKIKKPLFGLIALLLVWSGSIVVFTYPHYASYFNPLVGGPYEGWKYLSDSNVDFDQDRNQIHEWIAQQETPVHLHPRTPVSGTIVTRALLLNGITAEDREAMAWLREEHEPVARLSPAVFVYEVP